MMHYRKGENVEKQLTKDELPFKDFLAKNTDFLWMHVNGGTKVNNVITYAKNALDKGQYKHIVWSGNGGGVVKTISCAEILKRSYPLYQVTRTCYIKVEEHWKPQMEGLEEIVANRQIPSLHIFMSLDPVDDNVSGLQKPNTKTDFWTYNSSSNSGGGSSSNNNNTRGSSQTQNRPKFNQNRNRQRFQDKNAATRPLDTQDSLNTPGCSSGGNQQRWFNDNQKRKRQHVDNRIQETSSRKGQPSNQVETREA